MASTKLRQKKRSQRRKASRRKRLTKSKTNNENPGAEDTEIARAAEKVEKILADDLHKVVFNAGTIRNQSRVTRKTFSRITGISERALADIENRHKKPSESQRRSIVETGRLTEALSEIMKSEYISDWLQTPNEEFDGLKPIEVMERGEVDRIWELIYRLRSGMPV
ncbi:MAG: hypothetical protein ACYTF1_19490 [Planctomycetota bacterium]|jgi:DNA-binding transcriptional regulator YiaG